MFPELDDSERPPWRLYNRRARTPFNTRFISQVLIIGYFNTRFISQVLTIGYFNTRFTSRALGTIEAPERART